MDYEKTFGVFFNQAADAARIIALQYFRQVIPVDDKQDKSPVTQADKEIEHKLRELIRKNFPTHGIVGEEFGRDNDQAEFVWVIDPIDGTKSFATGRPLFGTILGLMHEGKPVMGLIDQAYTKERWLGITDTAAWHNGQPITIAPARTLENTRLYTGSIAMFDDGNFQNYLKLCRSAKWVQYSCDCYAYGLLAMGWADLIVEQQLGLHDVVGVAPIITGAGGYISDWNGNKIDSTFNGKAVAASSKALAVQAIGIMTSHVE